MPQADFFDLAALFAGALARLPDDGAALPFCPMLARKASIRLTTLLGDGLLGRGQAAALLLLGREVPVKAAS